MKIEKQNNLQINIVWKILLVVFISTVAVGDCKEEVGIYYCPMHPDYTSSRQGDCPICGMKLLAKKPINNETSTGSKISDFYSSNISSHNKIISKDFNRDTMESETGKLDLNNPNKENSPNPIYSNNPNTRKPTLNYSNSGFNDSTGFQVSIEKQKSIGVKTYIAKSQNMESAILSSGEVVYNPEMYTAIVEFRESQRLGNTLDPNFTLSAKRKLFGLGLLDDDIKVWTKMNPDILLTGRNGKFAYIFTQIFEKDLRHLQIGKKVDAIANSYPGEIFQGKIIGWFNLLDEKNRSTRAWIEVKDPGNKLTPRMFTETKIKIPIGRVLIIPRNAVIHTGLKNIVYVKIDIDRFRPVRVTIGEENNNFIQVISGLEEGDEVVVGANFLLDSEARMILGREL